MLAQLYCSLKIHIGWAAFNKGGPGIFVQPYISDFTIVGYIWLVIHYIQRTDILLEKAKTIFITKNKKIFIDKLFYLSENVVLFVN